MKTKIKKPLFNMDERNKEIAYRVMSIMYLLTIFALQGIIIYRQFALGQEIADFEDFAIVMTLNSIFLISALLYFGAIQPGKLKIKSILILYVVFLIMGTLFTYAKYNVFQDANLTMSQLLDKVVIIGIIIGIMVGFWILLSYLGNRRIENELE